MSTDKNIDVNRLSKSQQDSTTTFSGDEKNSKIVGFAGGDMRVPTPLLIKAGNESVFPAERQNVNAQIVITRDRPNSIFSGYGGKGHQKCSTIDIVAGRVSSLAVTTVLNEQGVEEAANVDPNFELDAARIYVSEKTDVDENFNLADVNKFVHESIGRSAVGIKADAVRIVGNEGVKIVTGVYENNSRGGDATPAGIVLVAMNDSEENSVLEVEPFAKGKKLEACLYQLEKEVYRLNGLVNEFITAQKGINNLFAKHNHHNGVTFTTLPCLNNFDQFSGDWRLKQRQIQLVNKKLDSQRDNLDRWNAVYLSPESKDYILSIFNGTN
tara:strand:+ start:85 stop:1062 length:978 start_codon:yes stop_codon:yes gene_type:complete